MARCQAPGHVLHGRGARRLRRGGARRPPPDRVPALARRPPARARAGAVAGPVQLPARGRSRAGTSRAGRSGSSTGRSGRSAPCSAGTLFVLLRVSGSGRAHRALAPGARASARSVAGRRARLRARALPAGAMERGPSAGVGVDAAAAGAVRGRAGAARHRSGGSCSRARLSSRSRSRDSCTSRWA